MVAGGFDYLLKTRMADMAAYRDFAGTVLWQLPGVRETRTYAVMEEVKNTHAPAPVTCGGQPPTSGEGEVTFSSPTAYTSKSIVNTSVEGKPERMTMDQSGKWLAADCGAVKPIKR
jgi:hypothetical protein